MKIRFSLFTLLLCVVMGNLLAQTDVTKHYELKGKAYTQSDSILNVWMKNEFPYILKKNKLQLTCSGCSSIYMDVVIKVDNAGKLGGTQIKTTHCCGGAFSLKLENQFLEYFNTLLFPGSLHNISFQYRLGTGLSC